jgi:hypothetical protein
MHKEMLCLICDYVIGFVLRNRLIWLSNLCNPLNLQIRDSYIVFIDLVIHSVSFTSPINS